MKRYSKTLDVVMVDEVVEIVGVVSLKLDEGVEAGATDAKDELTVKKMNKAKVAQLESPVEFSNAGLLMPPRKRTKTNLNMIKWMKCMKIPTMNKCS